MCPPHSAFKICHPPNVLPTKVTSTIKINIYAENRSRETSEFLVGSPFLITLSSYESAYNFRAKQQIKNSEHNRVCFGIQKRVHKYTVHDETFMSQFIFEIMSKCKSSKSACFKYHLVSG